MNDSNLPFSAGILNAFYTYNPDPNFFQERIVSDYELDYNIGENRKITINGNSVTVGNGSFLFRKPGDHYTSIGPCNCYSLTLDFSNKKEHLYGTYDRNVSKNTMQKICTNPLLDLIPPHFISRHNSDYIKIYDQLTYNVQKVNSNTTNNILINQLLFLVLSDICNISYNETETTLENKIINETCKYIQANLHKKILLKDLADNISLSPSYFLKMFKNNTNTTPAEYIISIRFSKAKQLLSESNLTVSQIAELCGFNDASYFCYYFKKRFGIKPSEYRENTKLKSTAE